MKKDIEEGYDRTAIEQARETTGNIEQDPVDRQILDQFIAKLRFDSGLICDLGCGPGQVARYFHDKGLQVVGVDLSAGMLREARKLSPDVRFVKADMRKLPFREGELAAIVGFLSLCHIPRWEVMSVLIGLQKSLQPLGSLLLTFHLGRGTFFRTESWGRRVSLQTTLFQSLELQNYLRSAGFKIEFTMEQRNQWGARGYLWASKPDSKTSSALSLLDAVLTGSAAAVEEVLAAGESPNTIFGDVTALHLAASDGRLKIMKLLLRAGAKVNSQDELYGGTPLLIAVQMGQFEAAKTLVKAGADISESDQMGNTPLHISCGLGRKDIVQWLLGLGTNPQPKNKAGEIPADAARRSGNSSLVTLLEAAFTKRLKPRSL